MPLLPKFLRPTPPRPGQNDGSGDGAPSGGNGKGAKGRSNGKQDENGGRRAAAAVETVRGGAAEGTESVVGWIDERSGLSPFLRGALYRKVPKGTNWYYTLGSATLFAFVSQAVTGVFLAMYYEPDPSRAYSSASHITNEVFLGELVRGMHKWGSTVMIVLIFLHMARTFVFGAYKYPRELNWVIGVVLLVLTLAMGFSGYLLPFDQRSLWATVVGVNINASAPIVGPYIADFLRGGAEFGATTLTRFYALHMLLIPGLIGAMLVAHLYLVAKLGTTAPPWLKVDLPKDVRKEEV